MNGKTKTIVFMLVLSGILLSAGCPKNQDQNVRPVHVVGNVFDKATGLPIVHATVQLYSNSLGVLKKAVTDENGSYSIEYTGSCTGGFWARIEIRAYTDMYARRSQTINCDRKKTQRVDFMLLKPQM